MKIQREIYLNPVEPAAFSLRAPENMETIIAVTFRDLQGVPITYDIAAQLQVMARSTARNTTYAMPAVDLVNGKAQAVIPAGDLSDPNGYRVRVVGTVDGGPALIASGVLRVIETEGISPLPSDVIDTIDLVFTYWTPVQIGVKLWQDDAKQTIYNIDDVVLTATVFDNSLNTTILVPFAVTKIPPNMATLTLTAAEVNTLPTKCWWELRAAQGGVVSTLAQGDVNVTGTLTP